MKTKKSYWNFFASIKLAIFCFLVLTGAFIAGSTIPQNESAGFYIQKYGEEIANFIQFINISDTFHSWWFIGLLILISINLIVCSIDRLPAVWKIATMDNLGTKIVRLEKMTPHILFKTGQPKSEVTSQVEQIMRGAGWKPGQRETEGGTLLFAQKTPWVRFGVYVVHLSILVIFAGGIISGIFGTKGSIMVRERLPVSYFFEDGTSSKIPFGFKLSVDDFAYIQYESGTTKQLRSEISIFENGKKKLQKTIEVNHPFKYRGYTFYQTTQFKEHKEFWLTIQNLNTGKSKTFILKQGGDIKWPEAGISLGILDIQLQKIFSKYRLKVWFWDGSGAPSVLWIDGEHQFSVKRADAVYTLKSKQVFSSGLQVTKDPGVWPVYIGCIVMVFGLIISFFFSHKRLWVYVHEVGDKTGIRVSGSSNKNKVGFKKIFNVLVDKLEKNETLKLSRE